MITSSFSNEEILNRQDLPEFRDEAAKRYCDLIELLIERDYHFEDLAKAIVYSTMWENRFINADDELEVYKTDLKEASEKISELEIKLQRVKDAMNQIYYDL